MSPFGYVDRIPVGQTPNYIRRWECDCGARGRWAFKIPGFVIDLLEDHFERMHDNRGTLIHAPWQCAGRACPFHAPSDHKMVDLPKHIRWDRFMLVERICPHGIGHPDPDSLMWVNERRAELKSDWGRDDGTHGCDGCCGLTKEERDDQATAGSQASS